MARGPATQKFQRAQPPLKEQVRRYRWGKTWGPLVGKSIRDYIAAHGG